MRDISGECETFRDLTEILEKSEFLKKKYYFYENMTNL